MNFREVPAFLQDYKEDINPNNTLFVARTNATIIGMCTYLINHRIPSQILKKDIADILTGEIKKYGTRNLTELRRKLENHRRMISNWNSPLSKELAVDKILCIEKLIHQVNDYGGLINQIQTLFERFKSGYKMTTCHGAKGLEAENIFIINPPIPIELAKPHPILWEQEIKLKYVSVTRSSRNIFYVVK